MNYKLLLILFLLVSCILVLKFLILGNTRSNFSVNKDRIGEYKITNIKKNINKSEYPIIVNFYTGDNGYEKVVVHLIDSLKKLNLPYYIVEIDSNVDKWEKICQQKPYVLLKVMEEHPNKNIVWLDADAVVEKMPTEFLKIKKDIGICYRGKELCSGTIFLKNNDVCRNIIDDWIKENNKSSKVWDQVTLNKVINEKYKQNTHKLPGSYIGIFDKNGVISHWQFSRNIKWKNSYEFDGKNKKNPGKSPSRYGDL